MNELFQSTLPARGATGGRTARESPPSKFQSTLPARGATAQGYQINPATIFQSTLPARGATRPRFSATKSRRNFNPRSPHGERQLTDEELTAALSISIHAPRTGSDAVSHRATSICQSISIHAPRTGSDSGSAICFFTLFHFNPRSPHGERPSTSRIYLLYWSFQSTLPARGATQVAEASDRQLSHFNPRSPHGERLTYQRDVTIVIKFQSTLPARGATFLSVLFVKRVKISIHAPRTGSDN